MADGGVGLEVRDVGELLAAAPVSGHSSRGDEGAVACGAVRVHDICFQRRRGAAPAETPDSPRGEECE
jgi:hypothetical protein